MTPKALIILLVGLGLIGWACEINSPFMISLNVPLDECGSMNAGNAWYIAGLINIRDGIESVTSSYTGNVRATRVSDILLYMPNPPAEGSASGVLLISLDAGVLDTLLVFTDVPFDSLRGDGISFGRHASNPGHVRVVQSTLTTLLASIQNPTGLPTASILGVVSAGTTTVNVPAGTEVCLKILLQVDVEVNK